jgi:cell division protein FtsQ
MGGLLLGFAVDRSGETKCEGYEIQVLGDPTVRFVTQESLIAFIRDHGHTLSGQVMNDIDTYGIEEDISAIPFVEDAIVYKTIDRKVMVAVEQRVPVLRLFFKDGTSCYLDEKARYLQLSNSFSHKCLPITGVEPIADAQWMTSDAEPSQELSALWKMARYIQIDDFWNAQIMQVDVDPDKGVVLIPRVGNHQIIMGSAEDFQSKLEKLKEFYDKGISQTNWNIYQSLDLRYQGQVVGVKR